MKFTLKPTQTSIKLVDQFRAIPSQTTHLIIQGSMRSSECYAFKEAFKFIPESVTRLEFIYPGWDGREENDIRELAMIFKAIPASVHTLDLDSCHIGYKELNELKQLKGSLPYIQILHVNIEALEIDQEHLAAFSELFVCLSEVTTLNGKIVPNSAKFLELCHANNEQNNPPNDVSSTKEEPNRIVFFKSQNAGILNNDVKKNQAQSDTSYTIS
ncbi:hypothetical protein BN59_03051 [Legionella massiliensis]|uniref:Leucine Rich repeats (2 copies) n=1 Tax=Legionella massiliensis TaxID=1034943 RepID=A0A078L467_9GAMM|nr:hypothetical protein [Legionella massiliensis]CDZ78738.1 hypothetical protein BN59_03051 [Legionella massiliensis]CEE14476.1 hypothetical protein BN1094_03051 [Legionella massiliensis]